MMPMRAMWRSVPLEFVRVDDETLVLGHLVVQGPPLCIGCLSLPVHPRTTCLARSLVHSQDQLTTDALATQLLRREEVLQVAHVAQASGAAMEDVVRQTDDDALTFCYQRTNGLAADEEAIP